MAVANVGLGAAISQLGAGIKATAERKIAREDALAANRAWREIEQWQLDYLSGISDRREELKKTQVDPETGSTVTGYQVEIETFGKRLDERFAQASANLSTHATEELEKRFNATAPNYGRYTADTLSTLELEDITAEIQGLASTDRVADAQELFELYSDRYSPADRQRLTTYIDAASVDARMTTARKYLQNHASAQGWDSAVELIDDPDWQAFMGLDVGDAAGVHNELSTFARTQEGKEQRAVAIENETAKNNLFADAMQDKLEDPTQIDQALRAGIVSPAEAKQLQELVKKGPATENDPQASAEAYGLVADVQFNRIQPEAALRRLDAMATRLTPAFRDARIADLTSTRPIDTAMRDITQAARRELVTTTQDLMTVMMTSGAGPDALAALDNQKNRQERLVNYHDDQMRRWLREHPEASEDDLYVESRRILARVRSMDATGRESLLESWEQQVLTPAASPWEGPNEGVIPMGTPQGLESVWDTMTTDEKQTALSALANGTATVEQIREMLQ
jgi:hypothetical protein